MKQLLIIALGLVLLTSCSEPLPEPDPGGLRLADAPVNDGRWQVLNYWAIWCLPCRKEIPELNLLARDHADQLIVYGINFDGALGEDLLDQTRDLGIEFVQLREDPAAAMSYPRPNVLPTTLVVAPSGNIVARLVGPQTVESLLEHMENE